MINESLWHCRVCGLNEDDELPWGEDGKTASFNICSCCGAEFGYDDYDLYGIRLYRKEWLEKKNAEWFRPKEKPANWSLEDQLKHIPKEFL